MAPTSLPAETSATDSPSSGKRSKRVKDYYAYVRSEVFAYLPDRCERVLDIGCGAGATLAAIAERGPVTWRGGVEAEPGPAERAKAHADRIWCADAGTAGFEDEIEKGSLDAIICLDVLEHMVDPWDLVRRISPLLRPGGRLVVSVPNIQNYKFVLRLAFLGDFRYRDAGLLDRTHLRFFVRNTARDLVGSGGLDVVACEDARAGRKLRLSYPLEKLSFGALTPLLARQFIVVGEGR